jgi:flagellar biosynthesis/type III secretory pathway chaperone
MNTTWMPIAQCLRDELVEYGGLLRLFEEQQRSLFERDVDSVMRLAHEIETQARALGEVRTRREASVAQFAAEHGQSPGSTLRAMLPLIEASAQPLLTALINEVNLLLHRVRRTSRHNHALLARTIELHQETLLQLQPQLFSRTYSPAGHVARTTAPAATSLSASG